MKKAAFVALVLTVLAASAAQAQFFGQLGPLTPRGEQGLTMAGGYLGFASHTWGLTGQVRMGLDPKMDVGAQVGYSHFSQDLGILGSSSANSFGARVDLKADLVPVGSGGANIVAGGNVDAHFSHTEDADIFGLAAVPGLSISGEAGAGQTIAGWLGLGAQVDFSSGESNSTALLRVGGEFDFTRQMGVVGEFNHFFANGGSDEFMVGVSYYLGMGR